MSGFDNLHRIAELTDLQISPTEAQAILDDLQATWGNNDEIKNKIRSLADSLKADPIVALVENGWLIARLGGVGIGVFSPASLTMP